MYVDGEVEMKSSAAEEDGVTAVLIFGGSAISSRNKLRLMRYAARQVKKGGYYAHVEIQSDENNHGKAWTKLAGCRVARVHQHGAKVITNSEEVEKSVRMKNQGTLRENVLRGLIWQARNMTRSG